MIKSAAPMELTHTNPLLFYKGNTPTEQLAFSKKLDKGSVTFLKTIKEAIITNSKKPQRGKTFVIKYTSLHKSTRGATRSYPFSKMDKSSVTIINSILDLI